MRNGRPTVTDKRTVNPIIDGRSIDVFRQLASSNPRSCNHTLGNRCHDVHYLWIC